MEERSGEQAGLGRLQAEEGEERVLGMVIGCTAGTDKQLAVQAAAARTAHTCLCLASYTARTGRARRSVEVVDGCEPSRWRS